MSEQNLKEPAEPTTPRRRASNDPHPLAEDAGRPGAIARRAVLRRGAKLVYVVPAVLATMMAKPPNAGAAISRTP
jgi:hypothetical protein